MALCLVGGIMYYSNSSMAIVNALYNIEARKNEDIVKFRSGKFTKIKRGRIIYHPVYPSMEFRMVTADALPEISEMSYCESEEVFFTPITWDAKDRYHRHSGRYLGTEITYYINGESMHTNYEFQNLPNLLAIEVIEARR